MQTQISVLVGTSKGAFVLDSDDDRQTWRLRGPFCDLWPINHMVGDGTAGKLWAAGGGAWNGAGIWHSPDNGDTWTLTKLAEGEADRFVRDNPDIAAQLGFGAPQKAPFTGQIDAVWSLGIRNGRVYAGAKPAALFISDDDGGTWAPVDALNNHESVDSWTPGAAGLTLHTIVLDPDNEARMWVGISAAGVFSTEDGGLTWDRRNRRANMRKAPANHPAAGSDDEIGFCVHNIGRSTADGHEVLFQQNHHGVYRSNDGGRSWLDITSGLPSTFGFPVVAHPHDTDTAWVFPLNGDSQGRYPVDARAAVWKSVDGGTSWVAKSKGLPAENCFFTVLRQAMANDKQAQPGVYFGTNSGSVFASRDEGESWSEIASHLPTVFSVEVMEHSR